MSKSRLVGNAEAAAYVGVTESTWRAYVARQQAPAPEPEREIRRGHALPVWRRATLDRWLRSRPGPGARTDLEGGES